MRIENKPKKNTVVLSFRTSEEVKKKVDQEAKKRKQTRAEYLESLIVPATLQPETQAA